MGKAPGFCLFSCSIAPPRPPRPKRVPAFTLPISLPVAVLIIVTILSLLLPLSPLLLLLPLLASIAHLALRSSSKPKPTSSSQLQPHSLIARSSGENPRFTIALFLPLPVLDPSHPRKIGR